MKVSDFRSFLMSERQKFVHYVRSLVTKTAEMEAEDIVHDVLIRMLERADLIAPVEFAPADIYHSLRNRVIDVMRTNKDLISLDAEPPGGGPGLVARRRQGNLGRLEGKERGGEGPLGSILLSSPGLTRGSREPRTGSPGQARG